MRLADEYIDRRQVQWELDMQAYPRDPKSVRLHVAACGPGETCVEIGPHGDEERSMVLVPSSDLACFLRRCLAMIEADLAAYDDDNAAHEPGWARRSAESTANYRRMVAAPTQDRAAETPGDE